MIGQTISHYRIVEKLGGGLVELTAKGRALITKTFREHVTAMEEAAGVLSKEERMILLRVLKKLGKGSSDSDFSK
jgi:hypothetical protein